MAVIKLTTAARTALAQALLDAFDTGANPCLLKFYDGAQPAGPSTAVTTQVLLGTLTCSDPIGSAANGALTFGSITQDGSADASSTATWARLLDGAGNAVADFDVTNTAGTGAIKLNTTTIVAGGPIQVNSFVITMAGA
jgi:hypothetical protein